MTDVQVESAPVVENALVEFGPAAVHLADSWRRTLLHHAVRDGRKHIAQWLLQVHLARVAAVALM